METRTNPWLIEALKNDSKKKVYQEKSKEAIRHGHFNRVFDHFDYLLPQPELMQLASDYLSLLRNIKKFTDDEGKIADLDSAQIILVGDLLQKIINIGILELFSGPKQVRDKLVKVLKWHDLMSNVNQLELLCAYVAGVFQCIYSKFPKSIEENMQARQCAEKFLNKNCKKIIIVALLQRDYLTQAEAEAALEALSGKNDSIFDSPAVIAGITVFSLAALAGIAFGIFAAIKSSINNSEEKKEDSSTQQAKKGAQ